MYFKILRNAMRFYDVEKILYIDLEITCCVQSVYQYLCKSFVCRGKLIYACTKNVELALGDITQSHLKTFIEEYLNAIQVFNHSRLCLYPGQPIVNLYFRSCIVEKTKKAISYRCVSSFASTLAFMYARIHVCGNT